MIEKPKGIECDVPIKEIFSDHEFNCRGNSITPGSVIELADDIKSNPIGLMQRIIIQPWKSEYDSNIKFRILAGHRRYQACKILKWKEIPAVIYTGVSEADAEVINLKENLSRQDLNIMQEAKAIDKMYSRGMTASEIAKKLDMGTKWVQDRLALLKLPKDVQNEAAAGIIKAAHIAELTQLYLKSPEKMYEGVRSIKNANGRRPIKVKKTVPQGPTIDRKFRSMSEVFKMQDSSLDALQTNLCAKALAWVIGEIGTIDLLKEIKKEAELMGIPWSIPTEYLEQHRLEERERIKRNGDVHTES